MPSLHWQAFSGSRYPN